MIQIFIAKSNHHLNNHIIQSSHMEEPDAKRQYEQLLQVYTLKRSECDVNDKSIQSLKTEIEQLQNKIRDFVLPPAPTSANPPEALQKDKLALLQELGTLNNLLKQQESQAADLQQQHQKNIHVLQAEYKLVLESNNPNKFVVTQTETQEANKLLHQAKLKQQEEAKKINLLQKQLEQETKELLELEKEFENLNKNKSVHVTNENEGKVLSDLQNQLHRLEKEESDAKEAIQRQSKRVQENNKLNQGHLNSKASQLQKIKSENLQLKSSLEKAEKEGANNQQNDKNAELQKEIKALQQANKSILKQIETLNKQISAKKQQEAQRKEQAKKDKKDKKNYKQQITEESKLTQLLEKQLQREKSRYEDTVKLRKSYVSNESLQILQKEYERHQPKNNKNLEVQQNNKKNVVRVRDQIKSRIQTLKQSFKDLQNENEKNLKDLRSKGDELVKEKLGKEKILNQITYKLNQFLKEYPDHEKKKEQAKNEEKRKKQEAKDKAKQEQRQKEQLKKKIVEDTLIDKAFNQDSKKTQWQNWDDWNKAGKLADKDESSFFNNKQFQIIAGVAAAILILTLSFS